MFAVPPAEEPATSYFERTATYNKRHLAGVGVAAVVVAVLAAVIVRGAIKPNATPSTASPAAVAVAQPAPLAPPVQAVQAVQPAAVRAVQPAPAPVAPAPVAAVSGHPLADIPITSTPSGAVVTLIANGTPRVLGQTPLFASVDPAQTYDVVVAMSGHPTSMQHLDPRVTKQIAVSFDGSHVAAPAPAPVASTPPVAPAAAPKHHHHVEARVAAADPTPAAPAPAPASHKSWNLAPAARPVAAEPAGTANGVLMIASKPPCEIIIDGKATRLETPQRSIALSPGTHSVTLINARMHINKTVPIEVAAHKPTKLIRDFTR